MDFIPETRFSAFCLPDEDRSKGWYRYSKNIELSAAFYPGLAILEVCLRNRMSILLEKYYGKEWLVGETPEILNDRHLEKLREDKEAFAKRKGRLMNNNDAIANMSFGFWTHFFHKKYDPLLWHKKGALEVIFPEWRTTDPFSRSHILEKLKLIQNLRNRIAHHEAIWNQSPKLDYLHALCKKFISAMSGQAAALFISIDQFSRVWTDFNSSTKE